MKKPLTAERPRAAESRVLTRFDLRDAIMEGAVERVRPKMMAVVAIMAGLLPIMWSTGTGSEIMQRIAVPNDRRHDFLNPAHADRDPGDLWAG
jgi:AcrB/AcrD/AcrF family